MKKLFFFTFFCFLLLNQISFAQQDEDRRPIPASKNSEKKGFDKSKLIIGGFPVLAFGTGFSQFGFSGTIGYAFTEKFVGGVNLTYVYYKLRFSNTTFSSSIYGVGPFVRYFILENFFAQLEYEVLGFKQEISSNQGFGPDRTYIHSLYIGGGYFQRFGRNSGTFIMLLYNLNQTALTPYPNPIIRAGFNIGF